MWAVHYKCWDAFRTDAVVSMLLLKSGSKFFEDEPSDDLISHLPEILREEEPQASVFWVKVVPRPDMGIS